MRAVLATAEPRRTPRPTPEKQALQAFQLYEFNTEQLVVEQSSRARAVREIERIATWYGWTGEVARALDAAHATCLAMLPEAQLANLADRMLQLENCVQNGGDAPDAPHAR